MSTPAPPRSRAESDAPPESSATITGGPRWYRHRIRVRGPWVSLVIPGIVGAIAYGSLRLFESAWSGAIGLVGGVMAAPCLLFVGAPFGDRSMYPWAVLASMVMWMLIGFVAARRATRNPLADWSDYWRHYLVMLVGIWVGAIAALAIAAVSVGEPLL